MTAISIGIRRDNDPFKRYWWAILLGFMAVGGWLCLPFLDSSGASTPALKEGALKSSEQSLDAVQNPSGAPGSAVDLSMEGGAYKKKNLDGPIASSLYEPPPEEKPAGSPAGAGAAPASSNLASALTQVSQKTSASADPTGWGGRQAIKAFTPPKASFGSLSGLGSGGGSTGASSSGGGSFSASSFGSSRANTGLESTRGLHGNPGDMKGAPAVKALQTAQSQGVSAAAQRSNDAAAAGGGYSFDGSGGRGAGIPGQGSATGGASSLYADLDSKPMNLKANDANLDKKKIEPPPQAEAKEKKDPEEQRKQMMMMLMTMVVGGLVNGVMGGVMGAMGMGKG
ncbi:MAG: hypothetical protein HY921_09250 [Elusimicrobia bacterium]|nr:hypothetical protein [Elusimicrobiota bacterium]